ncbi:hypothetical protein PGO_114570 [Plasmodium gonderi]|uniref:Uncharacterized protein n=1 Tax=Plasmodium gonderi TaxID=77519 RepID=A0A1Y1JNM9_PLAGO|nr:hypothetical protein PGO_114570 [Plasmodium gonderi]GAW82003.1 hypothetical protein PGO_114570 [Plasmodium gonderi]
MTYNKENFSNTSSGFKKESSGSMNGINHYLKVLVFSVAVFAIHCFNEDYSFKNSGSIEKSLGNSFDLKDGRILKTNFGYRTLSSLEEEEGSTNSLGIVDDENDADPGSVGNISLCSTIHGDVQNPEESKCGKPEKRRRSSKSNTYGSNLMGETTMEDMEYEQNFMRDARAYRRKGKLSHRIARFLKKHHYIVAAVLAAFAAYKYGKYYASGVIFIYCIFLLVKYIKRNVK